MGVKRGLAYPFRVGPNGGAAVVEGGKNNEKIISIGLGDGENANTFQQEIANVEDIVFNNKSPESKAASLRRIRLIFDKLKSEKRFQLVENSIEWDDSTEGESLLRLKYIDLETDEVQTFEQKLGA